MKYFRHLFFIFAVFFLYKCIDKFIMQALWNIIQQKYVIPSGIIYTIDSYVPMIISFILAISLSGWFFSIFKWELAFFDFLKPNEKSLQLDTNQIFLEHSKINIKDPSMGKQYVVQLTEEELISFWSTLEELDNNLEETVSFDFISSEHHRLTVHLIGGESKKLKRWGQNFIFLLFLFGTLIGVYLVITEIWSHMTFA
ncbi:hypothetical protein [Shimazuella kribbensis]|uniref:hypothetical protein n=1 Tax=Shimazuella kribbensis TaxID=139808 RepID=UPI00042454E8|nr:hypothetical protein [Shimazuella kribbensis]